MWVFAGRVRWDDGLAAAFGQPVPKLSGVVGTVGDQPTWGRNTIQQSLRPGQVVSLARRHDERERPAGDVGQRMNLGRPSAARSSDGVGEVPPFAPAAERCALT